MRHYFCLFTLCCCLSCANEDNDVAVIAACGVPNPIEDLDWLQNRVQELRENESDEAQYFFVSQAVFKGETVFIFNNCCPFCNIVAPVFDCAGLQIGLLNNEVPEGELSDTQLVFRPDTFSCQLN